MSRFPNRWFYDLETESWDNVVTACAIGANGQREAWDISTCDPLAELIAFIESKGGTWIAHAGGRFDHLLVWKRWQLPDEAILTGGGVLRASIYKTATFVDSFPRWGRSLAEVGAALTATENQKMDVDRGNIMALSPTDRIAYCMRDVEVLKEAWEQTDAWLAQYQVRAPTAGSASVRLLKELDPMTWHALHSNRVAPAYFLPGKHGDAVLECVRGGRTLTRLIGHYRKRLYVYDVKSSYPAAYFAGPLPVGAEPLQENDTARVWVDYCVWEHGKLPTPPESGRPSKRPGTYEGWLTSEQATMMRERGVRVGRSWRGWKPTAMVSNFANAFARLLFDLKEGTAKEAWFAKLILNSLHGKFAENPCKEVWRSKTKHWKPGGVFADFYKAEPNVVRWQAMAHFQPLTAMFIYGRARVKLSRGIYAVESAGGEFLYADTDSIMTDLCESDFASALAKFAATEKTGTGLGQWAYEGSASSAVFLAPKSYWLDDFVSAKGKAKTKFASKGMPRQSVEQAGLEGWLQALSDGREYSLAGLHGFRNRNMGSRRQGHRTLAPVIGKNHTLGGPAHGARWLNFK